MHLTGLGEPVSTELLVAVGGRFDALTWVVYLIAPRACLAGLHPPYTRPRHEQIDRSVTGPTLGVSNPNLRGVSLAQTLHPTAARTVTITLEF